MANRDSIGGALPASTVIADLDGQAVLRVYASSPGVWGNSLSLEWSLESDTTTISRPADTTSRYATVSSTAGFERSVMVRIEQLGRPPAYRVISAVGSEQRRLYWIHPQPGGGLPSDRTLTELDLTQPLRISRIAYGLTVRESGRVRTVYRNLHLVPSHERYITQVLAVPNYVPYWLSGGNGARPTDLPRPPEPVVFEALVEDETVISQPIAFTPGAAVSLLGGADGLALLTEYDFIGEPVAPGDSDFVRSRKTRGLQSLANCDEISLVAMPDILIVPDPDPTYEPPPQVSVNPCLPCPKPTPVVTIHQPLPTGELPPSFDNTAISRMQATLLDHCETQGDRFAVLSVPNGLATEKAHSREEMILWREQFETRYGALYLPWLDVVEPRNTASTRRIPACGHVVGVIAQTDLAEGIQRAPGNLRLTGVTDLSRVFDDTDHGDRAF